MLAAVALAAALFASPSKAQSPAITQQLTRAETIVTGKEEPERTRGFRETLREIAVKLTANPAVASDAKFESLLVEPARFIASYTYEDRNKHLKINDEQGTRDRPHYLRVEVNLNAFGQALQDIGYAVKLVERPQVALLLSVTDARGTYYVGASGNLGYEMREVAWLAGKRRALQFLIPAETTPDEAKAVSSLEAQMTPGKDAVSVRATLALNDDGYWRFTSVVVPALKAASGPDCSLFNVSGVTFDKALAGMADRLLIALTAGPAQVAGCPSTMLTGGKG
jgi:hypothetical protein